MRAIPAGQPSGAQLAGVRCTTYGSEDPARVTSDSQQDGAMVRPEQYERLERQLRTDCRRRMEMTFAEVARAVGEQLPCSAHQDSAWWGSDPNHTQAAWRANGHHQRVGKPLFGPLAGCHDTRRGTYRIVYWIDEDSRIVDVLDIDHRWEIYHRPQQ